jgi:hypothetical protein
MLQANASKVFRATGMCIPVLGTTLSGNNFRSYAVIPIPGVLLRYYTEKKYSGIEKASIECEQEINKLKTVLAEDKIETIQQEAEQYFYKKHNITKTKEDLKQLLEEREFILQTCFPKLKDQDEEEKKNDLMTFIAIPIRIEDTNRAYNMKNDLKMQLVKDLYSDINLTAAQIARTLISDYGDNSKFRNASHIRVNGNKISNDYTSPIFGDQQILIVPELLKHSKRVS